MCAKRKTSVPRLVDFAKSFYTDLQMDGMLHGVIVRSPVAKGLLKSVTHPMLPDGYSLITAQDIPGEKYVSILKTKIPVFAEKEVSYIGEPLGVLVGPDLSVLNQLQKEIEIHFERQNLTDEAIESQCKEQSTFDSKLNSISDGIIKHRIISGGGDAEMIFAESDIQVEGSYSSVLSTVVCSEPVGGLASFKQGTLTLYSPVQWFARTRTAICEVLNLEPQQVQIKKTLSAGNETTNLWYSVVVMAQLSVAAAVCGKPVKLVASKEDQHLFAGHGIPVAVDHRTAVSSDGRLQAMIVSIAVDAGVGNPFVEDIIDRMVINALGIYKPLAYKVEAYALSSSAPPAAVNMQRIDSQVFFAVENQMQRLCLRTGFLPDEIRLINSCPDFNSPFVFDFKNIQQNFNDVIKLSDFTRKYVSYKMATNNPQVEENKGMIFSVPIRGIGFATAFEGCGYLGSESYVSNLSIKVTMEIDGSVVIHSYPPSASIRRIWINLVSTLLDVPSENILIDSNFDTSTEPKYPNGFFGNMGIMTHLLKKCCVAIQKQRFRHPLPISVSRGITRQQQKQWDSEQFMGRPYFSMAMGSAVVEVELDSCTFRTNIRGIWISIDGGEILAREQATASVKSAVRQILSGLIYGDVLEAKDIHIRFIQSSDEPKQLGGLMYSLIPAAFTAAISQAFGQHICNLPVLPELICQPAFINDSIHGSSHQEVHE